MDDTSIPWATLRSGPARQPLSELGLVLTAVDIDNELVKVDGQWCLRVPESQAGRALDELALYGTENPPRVAVTPSRDVDSGWVGVAGYLVAIWGVAVLEQVQAFGAVWRDLGRMQAGLVQAGEYWRTGTALTLHLDLGHIAANSAFGAFFGLFAGRALGSGWAWFMILLGGMGGNLLNAFLQPADHRAVGASTAVFAALGLLTAYAWRTRLYRGISWRQSVAPIIAGIALLAYTGSGDENTDVLAHLTGFACGFLLGWINGESKLGWRFDPYVQRFYGVLAAVVVAGCWFFAFSPTG